jgi:hypothetical protein
VFSRREKSATTTTQLVEDPAGPGKGHATPKRRDAERERRERVKGPTDAKAARKADRERRLLDRKAQNEGMMRGDERYLPKRDLGPRRKHIRDWVDARRTAAEMFLPAAGVILVLGLFGGSPAVKALSVLIWMLLAFSILVDSMIWTIKLRKDLRAKYPNEPRTGDVAYALMRAMLVRRMRTPRPSGPRAKKA